MTRDRADARGPKTKSRSSHVDDKNRTVRALSPTDRPVHDRLSRQTSDEAVI